MHTIVTTRTSETAETPSFLQWFKNLFFRTPAESFDLAQQLAKGEMVRLVLPGDSHLSCDQGTVWITSDEGGPDIILAENDEIQFVRHTALLVEALQESRIALRG